MSSSTSSTKAILHPRLRAYQIWGTHRGVGMTVASTILCLAAIQLRGPKGSFYNVAFSKPVFDKGKDPKEADDSRVKSIFNKWRGSLGMPKWFDTKAALSDLQRKGDGPLLSAIAEYAYHRADYIPSERGQPPPASWVFFETLAPVEARLPSGNCQPDVYRELQLPGLLVGDTRPGGLETTISAFESLRQRDYDVQSVIIFKDSQDNHVRISEHFDKLGVRCVALRTIPERTPDERKDRNQMLDHNRGMARANVVKDLLKDLAARHARRIDVAKEGSEILVNPRPMV